MNVKPGDLAIIVRSAAGNEGAIVQVLSWVGPMKWGCGAEAADVWKCRITRPMSGVGGRDLTPAGGARHISDSALRPIRDPGDDARDETLAWKPVPLPEILPSLLPTKEHA